MFLVPAAAKPAYTITTYATAAARPVSLTTQAKVLFNFFQTCPVNYLIFTGCLRTEFSDVSDTGTATRGCDLFYQLREPDATADRIADDCQIAGKEIVG